MPAERVTRIAQAFPDRVEVRGRDLTGDLMGRLTFTEYFHLLLTGRAATEDERFFLDLEESRNRLVAAYLSGLAGWYAALMGPDPAAARAAYRRRCTTVGRPVTVSRPDRPDVVGTAVAVDDDGRLVVDSADGRHAWAAGDVTHVRSAG